MDCISVAQSPQALLRCWNLETNFSALRFSFLLSTNKKDEWIVNYNVGYMCRCSLNQFPKITDWLLLLWPNKGLLCSKEGRLGKGRRQASIIECWACLHSTLCYHHKCVSEFHWLNSFPISGAHSRNQSKKGCTIGNVLALAMHVCICFQNIRTIFYIIGFTCFYEWYKDQPKHRYKRYWRVNLHILLGTINFV